MTDTIVISPYDFPSAAPVKVVRTVANAFKGKPRHVVLLSPLRVYDHIRGIDKDDIRSLKERDVDPLSLRFPYKDEGDLVDWAIGSDVTYTIWRIGDVADSYSQDPNSLVARIYKSLVLDRDPVLNLGREAYSVRTVTWWPDIARAVVHAVDARWSHGEIFNIANPTAVPLTELARVMVLVARAYGYIPAEYNPKVAIDHDAAHDPFGPRVLDVSKLTRIAPSFLPMTMLATVLSRFMVASAAEVKQAAGAQ